MHTAGNTWCIFWSGLLVVTPSIAVAGAYVALASTARSVSIAAPETRMAFALSRASWELVAMLLGMFTVTFLSLAYRQFFSAELGGAEPGST